VAYIWNEVSVSTCGGLIHGGGLYSEVYGMERLAWMRQLKKDPVHKKIMHTKDELEENDDFDPEEAMEAAIDKRVSYKKAFN
jgi:hypothetical protein